MMVKKRKTGIIIAMFNNHFAILKVPNTVLGVGRRREKWEYEWHKSCFFRHSLHIGQRCWLFGPKHD